MIIEKDGEINPEATGCAVHNNLMPAVAYHIAASPSIVSLTHVFRKVKNTIAPFPWRRMDSKSLGIYAGKVEHTMI